MVFSDTTNKNGIIQEVEFWTNQGDGGISGDSTLLKQITSRVNQAFDRLAPILFSFGSFLRWDDANNTDFPVGTFNLVSGQNDYTISEDDNSLDILNIVKVQVLTSATGTAYAELTELTNDDPAMTSMLSPATTDSGVPAFWLKRGNTIHLFPKPNYAATNGCRIFFEREVSYFTSGDTTKEPGIPKPFHGLLPLYASLDWLVVNKPANDTLITRVEAQIATREAALRRATKGRFPSRNVATSAPIRHR